MNSQESGFTLIELLVVIAIIGTLASTVLATVQDARFAARDSGMISDIKQIQTALELYRNANGGLYPTTPTPIAPVVQPRVGFMTTGTSNLLPFLPTIPTSRNPNHAGKNEDYLYREGPGRTSYTILVRLYKNNFAPFYWCSVTYGGLGWDTWNGMNAAGVLDGSNYPPCFD